MRLKTSSTLLILVLLVFPVASLGQTSADTVRRIREAVEAKDWNSARGEVEKLRVTEPGAFQAKNYDYLLARISEESLDYTDAAKNYQTTIASKSLLSSYALWHLALLARSTGDLVLERERLRQLVGLSPDSLLYQAASLRLAESFLESGDYAAASATARSVTTLKNVQLAREGAVLLGQALLNQKKFVEAHDVFSKLVMQMPDASRPDDFALAAVRQLDKMETNGDVPTIPLLEADHLLRASVYQFNRDFAGARPHYQAVIDLNPQGGTAPNATYQLGRGLYLEGKYNDALKYFQTVSDQFPQTQSARDALGSLAATYLRLKKTDDAISAYKLFISRFPDASNPERSYLNIIDALHESGRYSEAFNWIQQTRARFKTDLGGALALFAQLRIHLAQNAWADVVHDADEISKFPDLGGTKVPGGTTPAEVAFLKAFAFEQIGRTDEAITGYLAIQDGRNEYYGNRATQRLQSMPGTAVASRFNDLAAAAKTADQQGQPDQARIAAQSALRLTQDQTRRADLLGILHRAYELLPNYQLQTFHLGSPIAAPVAANPAATQSAQSTDATHQLLGESLFELALYDEAIPELVASRNANTKSANTTAQTVPSSYDAYTLAVYSLRGGFANRAVSFAEQFWKTVPADYVLEVAPRELVTLLYPVPFRESLLKHATSRKVDPRFVLAIIRQESRYQVDVKSVSAARGMMQFIPATADEIASQLKLKTFNQDDLYSPDTAILFGSQYLAKLFEQFPNQPQAVAGSYNGGADNLTRWIARSKANDADRYVPEIGFSQSKDYVYKVMTNYWNYQRLYDAQLQPIANTGR